MSELRSPLGLKSLFGRLVLAIKSVTQENGVNPDVDVAGEADGTLRTQPVLYDHDAEVQVRWGADSSGVDQGAAHVKLTGRAEVNKGDILEQQLGWLKVIAFQLGEITGEQLVPGDVEDLN